MCRLCAAGVSHPSTWRRSRVTRRTFPSFLFCFFPFHPSLLTRRHLFPPFFSFFYPNFLTEIELDQGWGAPALDALVENDDATPRTFPRSSKSMDHGSRSFRGSIDEHRPRRSIDLSAPPGVSRHVLKTDYVAVKDRHCGGQQSSDRDTNDKEVEWSDIRNRTLSGYIA